MSIPDLPWGNGLTAWWFWDLRHGLIARQHALWYSDDGLKTWTVRFRSPARIRSMTTLGSRRVWITTGCAHQRCPTMLLRSEDRGLHWSTVGRTVSEPMRFVTPTVAYSIPESRDLVLDRSTDGGRNFQPYSRPCVTGGVESLDDVQFVTPTRGFALCTFMYGVGNQDKVLLRTDDAGRTWRFIAGGHQTEHSYVTRGDLSAGGYASHVSMLPDGHGWMPEQIAGLLATFDGGRHWNQIQSPLSDAFDAHLFPNGNGWAYGANGQGFWSIYGTSDRGQHWQLIHRFEP
jgi:photosystem II stability/assembly factor-like uncharacterized protein